VEKKGIKPGYLERFSIKSRKTKTKQITYQYEKSANLKVINIQETAALKSARIRSNLIIIKPSLRD